MNNGNGKWNTVVVAVALVSLVSIFVGAAWTSRSYADEKKLEAVQQHDKDLAVHEKTQQDEKKTQEKVVAEIKSEIKDIRAEQKAQTVLLIEIRAEQKAARRTNRRRR